MNITSDLAAVLAQERSGISALAETLRAVKKYTEMIESGLIIKKGFSLPTRQEEEQFFVLRLLQEVRDEYIPRI
jgi:hypothetical protein